MISQPQNGSSVIYLSLLVGFILTIMPLPEWANTFRPQWVALILIYWCMTMPERIGVGVGWSTGFLLDVLTGTLLGQHALGFSVVAYLMLRLHLRVRVIPLRQQVFTIFILLLVERLLALWSTGAANYPTPSLWYWVTPVVSTLLWPWIYIILRDISHRFHVS
ncbi:MAG: rod shape-determining protein MreD [Candidatus Thiodiazotropha lotti]|uniref:Rod shape-determining protein MreD n=1 Tax=Candidatus Thiodiazotropha endoloripes TaxID=1818881 RepID=A0A1E2ULI5_9GAMM|nr:rod shape-determining protein MreD [Candidatus Thiodiazotropha endoloripes]MCG7898658.1 rod shape-determining protein MreD [Candidatus Thiodiazotropha weberae]MCG7991920.1 rod shape-determining protein MreD [Candidatus Thiodiazotropha lotti]MCG7901958.1 rod shape-determining protein MreD [Candidatus Thiodiazotropha weberae]MCG7914879.1 rod shape-determining protein MreD [Candidatus Thiodiazotropha weberae]MCG7998424.1 rod shape-determining protein MreD [Candidatus Thiodiazotropha lotti]